MQLEIGSTVEIAEDDYLIGTGVLRLRVTGLGGYESHHGAQWRQVSGVEVCWNGADMGVRDVLVRVAQPVRRVNGKVTRTKLI